MAAVIAPIGNGGGCFGLDIYGMPGDRIKGLMGAITFDSSYPTGGEAIDLSNYFLSIDTIFFGPNAAYYAVYNKSTGKVLVYNSADATEVANATDLSTLVLTFLAIGRR